MHDPRYTWYDFRFFGDLTKMISERIRIHRANDLIKNKFEVFIIFYLKKKLFFPRRAGRRTDIDQYVVPPSNEYSRYEASVTAVLPFSKVGRII